MEVMPRHARLKLVNIPLHIMQRGVNRCACFGGDPDRGVYLSLLDELAVRHECEIHAYVLMTNHVHLLLTPREPDGASVMMKNLGQRYVQYFNRKHKRTGTLWEGRFRSSLVDSQGYLLRCHRYIELNPVRARMVGQPVDFAWSSHGCNAYGSPAHVAISQHDVFRALGTDDHERRRAYRTLFGSALTNDELSRIRDAARGGFALGRPAFIEEMERALGTRVARKDRGQTTCPAKRNKWSVPGLVT
jgi:putative transposase